MKAGLIIVGIWSAVLLFLSLIVTGAFGSIYSGRFYTFTLPFIIAAAVLLLLALIGLVAKPARVVLFWIVIPLHGLLILPFHFAVTRWPGSDDSPGMAWLCLIGGGSCIAAVMAMVLAIIGIVITLRKKRKNEPTTGEYSHVPRDTPSWPVEQRNDNTL